MIDLARPPWGWSTGLRATPRTCGLRPNFLQKPDLVLVVWFLIRKETGPSEAKEYTEKVFLTPEGNCKSAVWEWTSVLINFAKVPELRAYWIPEPGYNSMREILDSRCTYIIKKDVGFLRKVFTLTDVEGKYEKLKSLKLSVVGKYENPPDDKKDKETSLFWKGMSLKVETSDRTLLRME